MIGNYEITSLECLYYNLVVVVLVVVTLLLDDFGCDYSNQYIYRKLGSLITLV